MLEYTMVVFINIYFNDNRFVMLSGQYYSLFFCRLLLLIKNGNIMHQGWQAEKQHDNVDFSRLIMGSLFLSLTTWIWLLEGADETPLGANGRIFLCITKFLYCTILVTYCVLVFSILKAMSWTDAVMKKGRGSKTTSI